MTTDRPHRILLVEDHPIVRRGLAQVLEQEVDLEVCGEAEEAGRALDLIESLSPDLVIVDISLPGVDGIDLIKQTRAKGIEVPMLVLSMHEEAIYAERVIRAGGQGYVMKQEATEQLIGAIRKVMRGDLHLSDRISSRIVGRLAGGIKAQGGSPVDVLSDRELQVFRLIGQGHGTREIAQAFQLSVKTIESHREHIKHKLNLKNSRELVLHAIEWTKRESVE